MGLDSWTKKALLRRLWVWSIALALLGCVEDGTEGELVQSSGTGGADAAVDGSGGQDDGSGSLPFDGADITQTGDSSEQDVDDVSAPMPDVADVEASEVFEDVAPDSVDPDSVDPDSVDIDSPGPDSGDADSMGGDSDVAETDAGEPDVFVPPTIGTQDDPAADCLEVQSVWPEAPDGVYWMATTAGVFPAWCDMTTYGGGWTLISNRPYAPVPGAWGEFAVVAGEPPSPQVEYVLPFLKMATVPGDAMLRLQGLDTILIEPVAFDAAWETLSLGARLPLADGRYLIFADQPAAVSQAVCFAPGTYDTGFKCDGNDQIDHIQGLLSAFAADEICDCDQHAFKTLVAGCEVASCGPTTLVGVYVR